MEWGCIMLKVGTIIVIGEIHAESWNYLDWSGYSAILTRFAGYNIWSVEIIDFPELIIAIHVDDCNIILN
jgi:hypothetical protein